MHRMTAAELGVTPTPLAPARLVEVADAQGQRLDNYLLGCLKGVPKSRVYRMVRRGEVRVNGARARPADRLQRGDRVRIPPLRVAARQPTALAPHALYESLLENAVYRDDEVIVLNKPSGVAAHGGSGVSFGVIETLRQFEPTTRYALAHRLDRDTSGCLAVAKTRCALLGLHAEFRNGRARKRYDLMVAGHWLARLRRVELPLQRFALANGERRVRIANAGAPARTDFAIVRRFERFTWLAAFPKTGRTHQIRVHAAAAGHPIVGDDKYALRDSQRGGRLMLHATELALTVGGCPLRLAAPLPAEFAAFSEAD